MQRTEVPGLPGSLAQKCFPPLQDPAGDVGFKVSHGSVPYGFICKMIGSAANDQMIGSTTLQLPHQHIDPWEWPFEAWLLLKSP